MQIYTSYWSNIKKLRKAGIEPVSISRGNPKGWNGRWLSQLAPTWKMLKMSDEDYDREYERILASNNPDEIVRKLEEGLHEGCSGVALLCWEKDPNCCHRKTVAEWLSANGYEVTEFTESANVDRPEQLALF